MYSSGDSTATRGAGRPDFGNLDNDEDDPLRTPFALTAAATQTAGGGGPGAGGLDMLSPLVLEEELGGSGSVPLVSVIAEPMPPITQIQALQAQSNQTTGPAPGPVPAPASAGPSKIPRRRKSSGGGGGGVKGAGAGSAAAAAAAQIRPQGQALGQTLLLNHSNAALQGPSISTLLGTSTSTVAAVPPTPASPTERAMTAREHHDTDDTDRGALTAREHGDTTDDTEHGARTARSHAQNTNTDYEDAASDPESVFSVPERNAVKRKAEKMREEAREAEKEWGEMKKRWQAAVFEGRTAEAFILKRKMYDAEERAKELHKKAARRYYACASF